CVDGDRTAQGMPSSVSAEEGTVDAEGSGCPEEDRAAANSRQLRVFNRRGRIGRITCLATCCYPSCSIADQRIPRYEKSQCACLVGQGFNPCTASPDRRVRDGEFDHTRIRGVRLDGNDGAQKRTARDLKANHAVLRWHYRDDRKAPNELPAVQHGVDGLARGRGELKGIPPAGH